MQGLVLGVIAQHELLEVWTVVVLPMHPIRHLAAVHQVF